MIAKPYQRNSTTSDRRGKSGAAAKKRMAYHLNCSFGDDPDIHVLHDLRLEDPTQPQPDGSPGVCRFDHLLVHRWGMFIVDGRPVTGEVQIRSDDSHGDEKIRFLRVTETDLPSLIDRTTGRSRFLREFLQRHAEAPVGNHPFGWRTLTRFRRSSDRRGFVRAPMQLVIVVADCGVVERSDAWKEEEKRLRVIVGKADTIPDMLCQELERHRKSAGWLHARSTGDYGLWRVASQEAAKVAGFLAARHVDGSSDRPARPGESAPGAVSPGDGTRDDRAPSSGGPVRIPPRAWGEEPSGRRGGAPQAAGMTIS